MSNKIKIGLFGAGHLGKIHLKCLKNTDFEIIGVHDPSEKIQQEVVEQFGLPVFKSPEELLKVVDAVDIVSTTSTHFELAMKAISMGKHAFIEKPISSTVEEAKAIQREKNAQNVKVQVGHVERYNPALMSLQNRSMSPKFIEGHRLSIFNNRGNDVSVILDLMIHDLDLVLALVESEVVDVQANGVCVVSNTPDICNARITFQNGCVANLTASRISMKQMRKLRLFQENEYVSLDFLKKESQIIKLEEVGADEEVDGMTIQTATGKKSFTFESPSVEESNAIEEELKDFHASIVNDTKERVGVEAGLMALKLAYRINAMVEEGSR